MRFKITQQDNGASDKEVEIDFDGFEYGKDLTGRYCKVAQHDKSILKFPIGQAIRTSGKTYIRIS